MTDPNSKIKGDLETSGIRPRGLGEATPSSGAHNRDGSLASAIATSMRGALTLARDSGTAVSIALRGDPARSLPVRVIEGRIREIATGSDGRERVVVALSEDAEQIILLERIVRVARVE